MIHIPEWHTAANKDENERNPLEEFVYNNEPAGNDEKFRVELEKAINYAVGIVLGKAQLWTAKVAE